MLPGWVSCEVGIVEKHRCLVVGNPRLAHGLRPQQYVACRGSWWLLPRWPFELRCLRNAVQLLVVDTLVTMNHYQIYRVCVCVWAIQTEICSMFLLLCTVYFFGLEPLWLIPWVSSGLCQWSIAIQSLRQGDWRRSWEEKWKDFCVRTSIHKQHTVTVWRESLSRCL